LAAQNNAVGINAALRNKVDIRSAGTTRVAPAVLRQPVILNDEVRTAKASWLQILLLDKTTFTVGADARVVIDRFVYDPNREQSFDRNQRHARRVPFHVRPYAR
jgi:hypothetical protein